jgi:acyl-CoA thioesterase-1
MSRSPSCVALLWVLMGCANESGRAPDSSAAQANSAAPAALRAQRFADGAIIVFAGTSLTAGLGLDPDSAYPQLIQRKLDSAGLKFEVVNAGVSGETSSGLLRRLPWLLREPFEVFVIETGANDGLRGIPVPTMEANIQRIIEGIRSARRHAQIVLMQMEAPPNLGSSYTRQFHEVFPAIAKRNDVRLIPFLLDSVAGISDLNQGDGMHPNNEGERIVARNVWRALEPILRQ